MGIQSGYTETVKSFVRGLRPPLRLWLDEWCEKYAYIPRETGSAEPGRYNIERTPYVREIMQALSPQHPAKRIVILAPSQIFKTQVAINYICSIIDGDPSNILVLMPNSTLASRLSSRLQFTFNAIKHLAVKIAAQRGKDAKNTIQAKEFDGGTLYIMTSGSAKNLAEVPAKYAICDEVDRWKVNIDKEGDPIMLVMARLTTYGAGAKALFTSTPVLEGNSKILKLYLEGNQHICEVPCPSCGAYHELDDKNLHGVIEGSKVIDAWMVCPACNSRIDERSKPSMFEKRRWRATAEGDGETWSYRINAMYSPLGWASWALLIKERAAARKELALNNPNLMQVYVNTRLAQAYSFNTSDISGEALLKNAEDYQLRTVHSGSDLTCAVDVQGDRLELAIVSWGRKLEAWVIDYHVIVGNPTHESTWVELDKYITAPVMHTSGQEMKIRACFIDTGGNATHDVYNFARGKKYRHVLAVKGASRPEADIIAKRPTKVDVNYRGVFSKKSLELWFIGTSKAKEYLYNRFGKTEGDGVIHLSKGLPTTFFNGLVCEQRTITKQGGVKWVNPSGARNEPLDLMVYNLAAAQYLGLDRRNESEWLAAEEALKTAPPPPRATIVPVNKPSKQSFLGNTNDFLGKK